MGAGVVRVGAAAVCLSVAAVVTAAAPSAAEGVGYGGQAGELSVTWSEDSGVLRGVVAAPPDVPRTGGGEGGLPDPEVVHSGEVGPSLTITGYGFRGGADISIQVGDSGTVVREADSSGAVKATVPPGEARGVSPGVSVAATGMSPSGTTRVLVGSVPPRPSGFSPAGLVPWFAAVFVFLGGFVVWRRRKWRG